MDAKLEISPLRCTPVEKKIKKRCGEEDEKVISMTNLLEIKKASTNVKALYFKDNISDLNA